MSQEKFHRLTDAVIGPTRNPLSLALSPLAPYDRYLYCGDELGNVKLRRAGKTLTFCVRAC